MKITRGQLRKIIREGISSQVPERRSEDLFADVLLQMMYSLSEHSEMDIMRIRERIEYDFHKALDTAEANFLG